MMWSEDLLCPVCFGRRAMVMICDTGTADRMTGRANERDRFLPFDPLLPASDGALGAT